MRNPVEIIDHIPKPVLEFLSFIGFVFAGAVFKMSKLHEKGINITFKRFLKEAFTSVFIAAVAYAVVDQFLHFNKFFTYAFCGLAGSMSDMIYSKLVGIVSDSLDYFKKTLIKK